MYTLYLSLPLLLPLSLSAGGLLAGTLSGGVFWERDNREETFTPHPLNTIPGRDAHHVYTTYMFDLACFFLSSLIKTCMYCFIDAHSVGNCTCLSFESTTRHCLASFRPSKRVLGSPHSTHVVSTDAFKIGEKKQGLAPSLDIYIYIYIY